MIPHKMHKPVNFGELIGKTLSKIEINELKDEMLFYCNNGEIYQMYHNQECCEIVDIDDIYGDIDDLIGSTITMAEESTSCENPKSKYSESFTWTFYKLATAKGYVTIRWYGESDSYSVSVSFELIS